VKLTGGAQTVLSYADGPAAGGPAVTRRESGLGSAWYVSTRLSTVDLGALLTQVYADAGLSVRDDLPDTVEVVRRPPYLLALNHGDSDVEVGGVVVPAGAVAVIEEA
jgi:beta-galactosidase